MLAHRRSQGLYQGCFAKSHWGGKRYSEKWDLFCEICPKQAKIYSELPNHVRALLGIEKRKHSSSKYPAQDGSRRVPIPLLVALESMLMERIHVGEEVTYDFAASLLYRLVCVWNDQLQNLLSDVRAKGQQVLSEEDQLIAGDCEDDQQKDMDTSKASHMEGVLSSIQECKISSNSDSLRKLGCKFQYRNVSIHTNSFPFHSMQQNAHRICTCSRSSPVQQDCFVLLWLKAGLRYSLPSSF